MRRKHGCIGVDANVELPLGASTCGGQSSSASRRGRRRRRRRRRGGEGGRLRRLGGPAQEAGRIFLDHAINKRLRIASTFPGSWSSAPADTPEYVHLAGPCLQHTEAGHARLNDGGPGLSGARRGAHLTSATTWLSLGSLRRPHAMLPSHRSHTSFAKAGEANHRMATSQHRGLHRPFARDHAPQGPCHYDRDDPGSYRSGADASGRSPASARSTFAYSATQLVLCRTLRPGHSRHDQRAAAQAAHWDRRHDIAREKIASASPHVLCHWRGGWGARRLAPQRTGTPFLFKGKSSEGRIVNPKERRLRAIACYATLFSRPPSTYAEEDERLEPQFFPEADAWRRTGGVLYDGGHAARAR